MCHEREGDTKASDSGDDCRPSPNRRPEGSKGFSTLFLPQAFQNGF